MSEPIRIALMGVGKIARDQHVPAIAGDAAFELVATVSGSGARIGDKPVFPDLAALADSGLAVDAVALCTPPQVRRAAALQAIEAGWHVFLEKPPGATLAEVEMLRQAAERAERTLFASWHSRFAAGVEPARRWLADRTLRGVSIVWREDVRVWHPGQDWIWQPGGFGVFDPGINALSIATRILPRALVVEQAELEVPANRAAPIAARLKLRDEAGVPVTADFDFRQQGKQSWDIVVETDNGTLTLSGGGAQLSISTGDPAMGEDDLHGEYAGLYARFADLVCTGQSEVDVAPLRLVADAFLIGRTQIVDDFFDAPADDG